MKLNLKAATTAEQYTTAAQMQLWQLHTAQYQLLKLAVAEGVSRNSNYDTIG